MKRTRLKYYLRALGIGIIVTALLMGYSQKHGGEMSDEEIRQRAAQLGMVEQKGVLSEVASVTENPVDSETMQLTEPTMMPSPEPKKEPEISEPTVEPSPESTKEPEISEPTVEPSSEPTKEPEMPEPTVAPSSEPTKEPEISETTVTPSPEPERESEAAAETVSQADTVTVVISRGESSVTVSKTLAEAGLVEDYKSFDSFLCSGGYDKSISVGTYEIPVDATEEEIAKIITKKR